MEKMEKNKTELYLKSDCILLTCVFEQFVKASINEIVINPLHVVNLPGFAMQCQLKYTGIILQTLQDKDMVLTLENNIGGGTSLVTGDRHVKLDESKTILYIDATKLCDWALSPSLPYDENNFVKNVNFEDVIKTPDDSNIGYFEERDLSYLDIVRRETKTFPFCPDKKGFLKYKFSDKMNEKKPNDYTQVEKMFFFDWTNKENYLNHYRLLNLYVRHGTIVNKVHEFFLS